MQSERTAITPPVGWNESMEDVGHCKQPIPLSRQRPTMRQLIRPNGRAAEVVGPAKERKIHCRLPEASIQ
jgi:hypothetical protein